MLNYIWAFMILGGISYGLANGKAQALSDVIIESAGEAVSLSITMLGVMAMWCGIMEVARSEERRVGKECRSRWSPYH